MMAFDSLAADLPDVVPAWVLEDVDRYSMWGGLSCSCHASQASDPQVSDPRVTEPQVIDPAVADRSLAVLGDDHVGWAIPGVTGLDRPQSMQPPVSPMVVALRAAVEAVCAVAPQGLDQAQALADAGALLVLGQQLRVHEVHRVADIQARDLPALLGFRSSAAWLREVRPDGDSTDATLGLALREHDVLATAVEDRTVSLTAARKVLAAIRRCRQHVDQPDGLIDGQPAGEVIPAVVGHVVDVVCQHLFGLSDDDPRLQELLTDSQAIVDQGGLDLLMLEQAFTLLARWVPPTALARHLDELVLAVVPSELDARDRRGLDRAALTIAPKEDGGGWRVRGELSLQCGERLHTALTAEAARDPRNPADTTAAEAFRHAGLDPHDLNLPHTTTARPRSRPERLHDALDRLLERYLSTGGAGTAGKTPVQVSVLIRDTTLTGQPGSPPARGDSGALIPSSTVRRWWCDATVTAYLRNAGGRVLRTVHTQRTLTGRERRALTIETGGTCAGQGCCRGTPDPLTVLRPHHVRRFTDDGQTSLDDTIAICDTLHHDLHEGRTTVRLRDGRYLNEHGWQPVPPLDQQPLF